MDRSSGRNWTYEMSRRFLVERHQQTFVDRTSNALYRTSSATCPEQGLGSVVDKKRNGKGMWKWTHSEIPRVNFDRSTECSRDAGEFRDDESTLRFLLTDDVLHSTSHRISNATQQEAGEERRTRWCSFRLESR